MNRARVTASSRDAALRAAMRAATQASLIAPKSAAEEHAAELAQGPEAAIGDDPLGAVQGEDFTTDDVVVIDRPEADGDDVG
jgi:DNA-directed RNA polymerase subunit beta'